MNQAAVDLKLGDSLDFMRTVWAVDHALQNLSRAMEKKLGLTGAQRLVVRAIGQLPGISGIGLARMLHLDPSSLTWHVSRLVKRGIVERTTAKDDHRRIELRLTAHGKRLDVATPGTVEAAVDELTAYLHADDLDKTRHVLGKLAEALQRQRRRMETERARKLAPRRAASKARARGAKRR